MIHRRTVQPALADATEFSPQTQRSSGVSYVAQVYKRPKGGGAMEHTSTRLVPMQSILGRVKGDDS